jgi:hypothetical protein
MEFAALLGKGRRRKFQKDQLAVAAQLFSDPGRKIGRGKRVVQTVPHGTLETVRLPWFHPCKTGIFPLPCHFTVNRQIVHWSHSNNLKNYKSFT